MASEYDTSRYNATAIAPVIGERFRRFGLPVKLKDAGLVHQAILALRLLGMRKPLFVRRERFVVLAILLDPQIFSMMSPQLELAASTHGQQLYWYGTGRSKERDFTDQLRTHLNVELPQDAFMEIDISPCLSDLKDLLEWPSGTGNLHQPSAGLSEVMSRLAQDRDFARQTVIKSGENLLAGWRTLSEQERRAAAQYAASLLNGR